MLFVFFQEQGQGVRHNKSASTDKDDVVLSGTCQCFFYSFRHGIADRARQTVEDCFCRKIFRRHCPLHGCLRKEVKGFFRHQSNTPSISLSLTMPTIIKRCLCRFSSSSSWICRYCQPPALCPVSQTTFGFSCKPASAPSVRSIRPHVRNLPVSLRPEYLRRLRSIS